MPLGDAHQPTMTPGRKTQILFDFPETVLGDPGWSRTRRGAEIAKPSASDVADKSNYQNVYFWPAMQVWTLKPIQTDISKLRERDVNQPLIVRQQQMSTQVYDQPSAKSGLKEENSYHPPSDLPGIAAGSGLMQAVGGDPFIGKLVTAPGSYDLSIATGSIQGDDGDIVVDRISESVDSFRANQAYFVRWHMGGISADNPSVLMSFLFGQYAIAYLGDGRAYLIELFPPETGIPNRIRLNFRYAEASQIANRGHTTALWPTVGADGRRYLVIDNAMMDAAGKSVSLQDNRDAAHHIKSSVYCADSGVTGNDPDQSPGLVTKAGHFAVEMRRDIKIQFQISILGFETDGLLTDLPNYVQPGSADNVSVQSDKIEYPGTSIIENLLSADSDLPFADGDTKPYVQFVFHGPGTETPVLRGYQIVKVPTLTRLEPGQFAAYNWGKVTVNGYDGDPQSQGAQVIVRDPLGIHTRLRNRGRGSAKVQVLYEPPPGAPFAGNQQKVVLHSGYWWRPTSHKKGKIGGFNNNPYPSPDYREFDIKMLGVWKRLQERVEYSPMRQFAIDYSVPLASPTDNRPPWKVTDVIVYLLQLGGFALYQIAIPDLPFRLYPGKTGSPAEVNIQPETGYAEIIQRLAKNYLGQYIFWDANAGIEGQWRLIPAFPWYTPASGTLGTGSVINTLTPVAAFVTQPAAGKIPHLLSSYPINTYPVLTAEPEEIPIPPDFNLVVVGCPIHLTTGKDFDASIINALPNLKSYNVPGYPNLADPNHPDYIGYPVPLVIYDATIAAKNVGTTSGRQETQNACNFMCNRYYDFLCHGQLMVNFRAPLAFIFDGALGQYRSLNYQDPVLYNGVGYLVKSCRPDYDHDINQMADYELIRPSLDAQ